MDPARAKGFVNNLSAYPEFRKKFGGLYTTIVAALERLGGPSMSTPEFLVEKVERIRVSLAEEEELLAIMEAEVAARKERVEVYRSALSSAECELWDDVIGFESRLPALPPRPSNGRARRKTRPQPSSSAAPRGSGATKRKRSSSRAPVSGVKRPATGRTEAEDRRQEKSRGEDRRSERSRSANPSDRSRRPGRQWPPRKSSTSTSRRRSVSRAPSVAAVYRDMEEHPSMGHVSRGSAKRGRMSDLLYDSIQERNIASRLQEEEEEETRVVRRVESPERRYAQRDRDSPPSDYYALDIHGDYSDFQILDSVGSE